MKLSLYSSRIWDLAFALPLNYWLCILHRVYLMVALLSNHHYLYTNYLKAVLSSTIIKFIKNVMPQKGSSNVKNWLRWERKYLLRTLIWTGLLVLFCSTTEPHEVLSWESPGLQRCGHLRWTLKFHYLAYSKVVTFPRTLTSKSRLSWSEYIGQSGTFVSPYIP